MAYRFCIKQGISFDSEDNDPIYVVIMLCAISGDEHINMITALADIFSDDERLSALLKASSLEKFKPLSKDSEVKMKKILIVCGNGLGSSFIVEMNVKNH